jgi:hypothetical protein
MIGIRAEEYSGNERKLYGSVSCLASNDEEM